MTMANKNCFRSQGGSVIESSNLPTGPDTQPTLLKFTDGDEAILPHAETPAGNPLRRAIKQYYFYD